jgi:hypothetical protein
MRILFAVVLIGLASGYAYAQDAHESERYKADMRMLDEYLPIVDFASPKPTEPAARAKRQAKDRRHNRHKQSIISEASRIRLTTTVYHWPLDFPALPITESELIVLGQITASTAHVSENRSGVYSEVEIKIEDILKGTVGGVRIVAEREGGRVRFPSGEIYRYWVDGIGIPKVGHSYLLFLKPLEDGDFSIITGYELEGTVSPLDRSGVVDFERYKGAELTTFMNQVRELITNNEHPR